MSMNWNVPLIVAAGAVAVSCAVLSPIVVAKRWAYVSEGIGHSAFGGAGVVWLLAIALPQVAFLHSYEASILAAGVAALGVAMLVGYLHRRTADSGLGFDTAVGIVLTATLAFGFAARSLYDARFNAAPVGAEALLFGSNLQITTAAAGGACFVTLGILGGLALNLRAVLGWVLHDETARLQGTSVALVEHALLLALALTIALGAQLVGAVLVAALLVVPGAIATLVARDLKQVWTLSAVAAVGATAVALVLHGLAASLPLGPLVVGGLGLMFVVALLWSRLYRAKRA